jgi:hypothetical protein
MKETKELPRCQECKKRQVSQPLHKRCGHCHSLRKIHCHSLRKIYGHLASLQIRNKYELVPRGSRGLK